MQQIEEEKKENMISSKTLLLAPMVRIGTLPFRLLARRYEADHIFTQEIIDLKLMNTVRMYNPVLGTIDFVSPNGGTLAFRAKKEEKDKLIVQIGTANPQTALKAAKRVQKDVSGIDVNMGCPKHFSTHGGMGSQLLKTPDIAAKILSTLSSNLCVPVSCKIRLLPTLAQTKSYIKLMASTGIRWIAVHLRTVDQLSKVPAHWDLIRELKSCVDIPLYVNGDFFIAQDVKKIEKLCDGCMIARGAIHNINIFKQVRTLPTCQVEIQQQNELKSEATEKNIQDAPLSLFKIKEQANQEYKVDISKNLAKIIERREEAAGVKFDQFPLAQEYFKLAIETGNGFGNTKYNLLYMFKTHKAYEELFRKIQKASKMQEIAHELKMEYFLQQMYEEKGKEELLKFFKLNYYKERIEVLFKLGKEQGIKLPNLKKEDNNSQEEEKDVKRQETETNEELKIVGKQRKSSELLPKSELVQ